VNTLRGTAGTPARQRGASLVVGLVLLLVLSVLAISTMSSATFGLTMAGNAMYSENAFQMAETGIEVAMNSGPFSEVDLVLPETVVTDVDGEPVGTHQATVSFQQCTTAEGFSESIDPDSYRAYHFQIDSVGTSFRGAQSRNQQDFYLVGPNGC
jgi:uncharacterized membrane protein